MESGEQARVVLVGKSRDKGKFLNRNNFLSDINPTEIPKEFIHKITVSFDTGHEADFGTDNLEDTFTISHMHEWLSKIDRKGRIEIVEITLDLDLIYDTIKKNADSIFAKYF